MSWSVPLAAGVSSPGSVPSQPPAQPGPLTVGDSGKGRALTLGEPCTAVAQMPVPCQGGGDAIPARPSAGPATGLLHPLSCPQLLPPLGTSCSWLDVLVAFLLPCGVPVSLGCLCARGRLCIPPDHWDPHALQSHHTAPWHQPATQVTGPHGSHEPPHARPCPSRLLRPHPAQ